MLKQLIFFPLYILLLAKTENEGEIVRGVRYKRGSVKVVLSVDEYHVILKKYWYFKIPFYYQCKTFKTLEEAENEYSRLQSYLYRIS